MKYMNIFQESEEIKLLIKISYIYIYRYEKFYIYIEKQRRLLAF